MTARRSPNRSESQTEQKSASNSTDNSGSTKLPLMGRTRLMGMRGLHASSIGFVLVGCIAFGFGVGTALDKYFGTTFCMPVGVLVGIAAGFVEMFRTLGQLQNSQNRLESTWQPPTTAAGNSSERARSLARSTVEEERPRPRLFEVPAPPTPSYLRKPEEADSDLPVIEEKADAPDAETDDVEALIEKLLSKGEEDKADDSDKKTNLS
jgi:hypothetical protein